MYTLCKAQLLVTSQGTIELFVQLRFTSSRTKSWRTNVLFEKGVWLLSSLEMSVWLLAKACVTLTCSTAVN